MKTVVFLPIAVSLTLAAASMQVISSDNTFVQDQRYQGTEAEFERYRQAIKDTFQIDIKNFKDSLTGGIADGKAITGYDLAELLTGIRFEMEHTRDGFIALEIATDHLERISDYYSRLGRLERDARSDKLAQM
jgi:hypothetical protein